MFRNVISLIFIFASFGLSGQILFEDEAAIRGITEHTGTIGNGNGITFVDYDGDGWDDLTIPSGSGIPLRFYKNFNGYFVEQQLINPPIEYAIRAISWVDYDNDGDKDLFIASDTDGNRLYKQNTNGNFTDVTIASGLPTDDLETYGITWGDINNDGCLDLYLSNRSIDSPIINYLFKNNCDGTFTEFTENAGLLNTQALTLCATFFDYNNDGWQDLHVSNDKHYPNFLYKNNGDGTFTDVSTITNTDIIVDAMSVTVDDYNADGFFDLYITNTPNEHGTETLGSILLRNDNGERFIDVSAESNVQLDSWTWGANFLDADNDSDLDLYVSSMYTDTDSYPAYAFYENNPNGIFTQPSNIGFDNNNYKSYGSATGDANNDGKVDIAVINNFETIPNLWVNNSTTTNNYLTVELEGTASNKDGVGAVIELLSNGKSQYRYVANGESYLSQNSFKEFFGLGDANVVDYVKITWLSGIIDVINNVAINQTLKVVEGANSLNVNSHDFLDVRVWPNPSKDQINISNHTVIDSVKLYDVSGRLLVSKNYTSSEISLNVSNLPKGIYFAYVLTNGKELTIKLFKS